MAAYRVLIVEDEIITARDLAMTLERLGYEVPAIVSTGEEAVEKASETKPDVVIMDIKLDGEMDGIEAADQINTRFHIPIIYLTGNAGDKLLERTKLTEPMGYLLKPFQPESLRYSLEIAIYKSQMNKRLMESEQKFRNLFNNSEVGMFRTMLDGSEVIDFNDKYLKMLNRTREEVKGKPSVVHWADPHEREEMVRKLKTDGQVNNLEIRLLTAQGEERTFMTSVILYPDQGILEGSMTDITESKRAEEKLQENTSFLNTLLNTIPVPLFYKDTDGRFIGFNKSFEKFYCKTSQELVGKSVFDIYPGDLAEVYHNKDLELFHNPGVQVYDAQFKDDLGAVHDVVFHKSTYQDSQGQVLGLIGVILDITERKRAAEREQLLVAAIEYAADGIVITDTAGIIQYVNPAEETISGYSRDELVGQGADIFKSDKHHKDFHRNLWETINEGNVWSGRFINRKKDGTEYNVDATISPVYDKSGNLTNFVGVKHDVTKQLELQGQLFQSQKMEAVGTLAGGLAHDFNNMLQVIQGLLELIMSSPDLPEGIRSSLDDMERATVSGAELVKGILLFSRKIPFRPQAVNLNRLVAQVTSLLTRTISKPIDIYLLMDQRLSAINCDPTQIEQLLINLVINARDAMPHGGGLTIETRNTVLDEEFARTYPDIKPGRYVLLSVTDTGTGMDPETVKHLFEPFFTTKEPGKGTGLGLSVVYGIVEKHGGRIICDSQPSVGTTFRIYFPATDEVPKEQYSEKKKPPKGQGETILLIDDEPHFLVIASRLLNGANYKMVTASNGTYALELYEKHREEIRLVILDLLMPAMDGQKCLEEILRIDPKARVLIATGVSVDDEQVALAIKTGAKGSIHKPYDTTKLLTSIRDILDRD